MIWWLHALVCPIIDMIVYDECWETAKRQGQWWTPSADPIVTKHGHPIRHETWKKKSVNYANDSMYTQGRFTCWHINIINMESDCTSWVISHWVRHHPPAEPTCLAQQAPCCLSVRMGLPPDDDKYKMKQKCRRATKLPCTPFPCLDEPPLLVQPRCGGADPWAMMMLGQGEAQLVLPQLQAGSFFKLIISGSIKMLKMCKYSWR